MSKENEYYLNKGKLKLNMLDDDVYSNIIANNRDNLEGGKLKVSKDIYNTLHYMGKFITKGTQKDKEQINKRMLKRIAKSAKVNDVTIPIVDDEAHLLEHTVGIDNNTQQNLYITDSAQEYQHLEEDSSGHIAGVQNESSNEQLDVGIIDTPIDYIDVSMDYDSQRPLPIDECIQICMEMKAHTIDEAVSEEHKVVLAQKQVDDIIEDILEFKYIEDDFHHKLRTHIQNKISLIQEGYYQQ